MSQDKLSGNLPVLNKKARTDLANQIIKRTIPALLVSNSRAAHGVRASQLFRGGTDLPPISDSETTSRAQKVELKVKVVAGDSLEVAHTLRVGRPHAKIAVLNMASPMQPGGGVLRGSKAQEESLCMRSTLYPSLRKQWYRLPDDGVAWTEDVLVFGQRQRGGGVKVLEKGQMWYVDVVSCPAVRMPDLKGGGDGEEEEEGYMDPRDEERMVLKIKYIMRACVKMGAHVVVLGALGCGAYGNPVGKVARIMRKCLLGRGNGRGPEEDWAGAGIEEVVFAILDETPQKKVWGGFEREFKEVEGVVIEE